MLCRMTKGNSLSVVNQETELRRMRCSRESILILPIMLAVFGPLQATAFHSLKVVVPRLSIVSIGLVASNPKRFPEPHGHGSFRPSFSWSSFSPCTSRWPFLTLASDGYPFVRLLIFSKANLFLKMMRHTWPPLKHKSHAALTRESGARIVHSIPSSQPIVTDGYWYVLVNIEAAPSSGRVSQLRCRLSQSTGGAIADGSLT